MTRKPNPENLARQDRVLAILRDSDGFPMSAGELAAKLDETKTWTWKCRCRGCGHEHQRSRDYPVDAGDLRPMLMRLARDGHVERLTMPEMRRVYWRAITTESAEDRSDGDSLRNL